MLDFDIKRGNYAGLSLKLYRKRDKVRPNILTLGFSAANWVVDSSIIHVSFSFASIIHTSFLLTASHSVAFGPQIKEKMAQMQHCSSFCEALRLTFVAL